MKTKPHIRLKHYPKSKRSYWGVSAVGNKGWRNLTDEERNAFSKAHAYTQRRNKERQICTCCGKEL